MSLNRNGTPSVHQQNKKQLVSSFQCQRCRMALVPHKSLIDLKPAQFNLLTSSLQLAADTKKKQHVQRQKLKSSTNGSRKSTKSKQGNTLFGFNWYSHSDEPDMVSSGSLGLSNLPAETQNLLFSGGGTGSNFAGSFIAIPDTRTVRAEQRKSLQKQLSARANNNEDDDEGSTTDEDEENDDNSTKMKNNNKNEYKNNGKYSINTAPIKNLTQASKGNDSLNGSGGGGNDDVFSSKTMTLETLFDIISSKSEIDYPVCSECAEVLKNSLKQKYEDDCKERDTYIKFFSQLQAESDAHFAHHPDSAFSSSGSITSSNNLEVEELNKEIEDLNTQNEQSLLTLKQAETQQEELEKELESLRKELKSLQMKEEEYYKTKNQFALEISELIKENDRVSSVKTQDQNTLTRLQKINTYNDVFCIGFDGTFGTINGLRLGYMRDKKIEWSEINAAWGQVVLLLATIVNKLDIKLVGYRLRPQGSTSKIDQFDMDPKTGECTKVTSLELYLTGDYSIERYLSHKRFDSAMIALLAVLKQIEEFLKIKDPGVKVPYAISHDKIGDFSIRLYADNWTKACKHVLTNAKWMLAYVSLI